MIELILPIYQRPHRLKDILTQLKNQTNQNFNLYIWNNSGTVLDVGDFPSERIQVINAKQNNSGGDRWKLIPTLAGNPIISFDDDEELEPDFVEYNYQQYLKYGKDCLLGWYSKTWDKDNTDYSNDKGFMLPEGTEVDYVGSGGMCGDRRFFVHDQIVRNPMFYKKYQSEDLFISYFARKLGMKIISILPKCKIIKDELDSCHTTKPLKKEAYKILINSGWKFYG
jgi:hypothetical protein